MVSLTDLNLDPLAYAEPPAPERPEGDYLAICTTCERRENSKGTGELIFAEFTVLRPEEHAESKLGAWYNIVHPKPFAVKKGLEALLEFSKAAGFKQIPANTIELVGRRVLLTAKLGKPTEQYPNPRLDIIRYSAPPVELQDDPVGELLP